MRELDVPGELYERKTYPFEFSNVEMTYESYNGVNVWLRYIMVTISRNYVSNIVEYQGFVFLEFRRRTTRSDHLISFSKITMSQNYCTMTGDNSDDSYERNLRRVHKRGNRVVGGFTTEHDDFIRDLADIFHLTPPRASSSSSASKKNQVLEVKKLSAVNFTGADGVEPNIAEYWLENIERQMSHVKCDPEEKYMSGCCTLLPLACDREKSDIILVWSTRHR